MGTSIDDFKQFYDKDFIKDLFNPWQKIKAANLSTDDMYYELGKKTGAFFNVNKVINDPDYKGFKDFSNVRDIELLHNTHKELSEIYNSVKTSPRKNFAMDLGSQNISSNVISKDGKRIDPRTNSNLRSGSFDNVLNDLNNRKLTVNGEDYLFQAKVGFNENINSYDFGFSLEPLNEKALSHKKYYNASGIYKYDVDDLKSVNEQIDNVLGFLDNFEIGDKVDLSTGSAYNDFRKNARKEIQKYKMDNPSHNPMSTQEEFLEFSKNIQRTPRNTRRPKKLKNADKSYVPEVKMNGNNLEFDSIYNYSTPKKVKTRTGNTPTKTFKDWRDQYTTSGLWTTGQGQDGSLGRVEMDMSKGSGTPGYSNTGDIQLMNSWAMATDQEIDDYIERLSKEGYGADDLKKIKDMMYDERNIGRHISVDDWLKNGNVRQNHTDSYRHFKYNGKEYYATGKGHTGFWDPNDLESPVFMNVLDAETGKSVDFGQNFFNPNSLDPSNDYDYFYKVINDIEDLGYVSLNDMKDHINKNIEKNNTGVNTQQTQTQTQTRKDRTNVNTQPQTQTARHDTGAYVNTSRLDIDEATAVSTMDISDPFTIHQRIVDGNGTTRDITWKRKGRWSDQKDLVSDVTWNNDGIFDNITQTYSGKDISPIDWKNAADWSDDYILGRAGDDEKLLNSMMNARDRKIEARRKYEEKNRTQQQSSNTADNTAQQQVDGPKAFDPDDPTTWTDKDIANMADGDPDFYEELMNQRNAATGGNTHTPDPEGVPEADLGPDMDDPFNWTDDYIEEMSEGDPDYYEQLDRQRREAIYKETYKDIDPSNPSSWTDDYILDTAMNEDEFNWMNEKMRQAKNLDIVDELNQQRRASKPEPNRQQRREVNKEIKRTNRNANQNKSKKTKKQKERDKRRKQFEDRQRAMGNDPDEIREINRAYNEAKKIEKQQRVNTNGNTPDAPKSNPRMSMPDDGNVYRPGPWKDPQQIENPGPRRGPQILNPDEMPINHMDNIPETSPMIRDYDPNFKNYDMPKTPSKWGQFGKLDALMTGVNILGTVSDYKTYRREGHGVVSSAVRAGARFALYEALGMWALPVELIKNVPGAVIKGADMLYKENRRMNSAASQQVFGDAQFLDTQQLATMRQSGMEMAKMAQYNLQQTLMGNEASYLHR